MATPLKVPGHVGFPVIGEKSLEFYRDAIGFVNSRIKKYEGSRLFTLLFLNKPTVFVASNKGVQELLNDEGSCFEMGYKQFMSEIYGDNVLFKDGEEAQHLRSVLQQLLLANDSFNHFTDIVDSLTSSTVMKLDTKKPVEIYKVFKRLATEICLTLFLDVNFETASDLAEKVVSLTTTHWHGIISFPVNLKVPILESKSTFGHALEAKAALLKIIEEKLQTEGFPQRMRQSALEEQAANHVLLFTSALVPKALASMLTAFVVHTANRKSLLDDARSDANVLENILLELQRLWPPFAGGRRIAKKDAVVDGHRIPAGHAVVFMTQHAHRDPAVFSDPDSFIPARWSGANKDHRDKLFLFGGGSRCCIGQHMVWHILKTVSSRILENFQWDITPGQSLQYKWLPVSRPKENVTVMFLRRGEERNDKTGIGEGEKRENKNDTKERTELLSETQL